MSHCAFDLPRSPGASPVLDAAAPLPKQRSFWRPVVLALIAGGTLTTNAQTPEPSPTPTPAPTATFTLGGYVEALYSYNFDDPSNGITNFRGFDNRHNTFTLSNVALDANGEKGRVTAKLTLQAGHTGNTYYLAEPSVAGSGGASSSDLTTWRFIQQAYVGYKAPVGKGLLFQGGLFLSPIGYESMAVKDNWNWSRSNLFFGLPFYHTGVRASYDLSDTATATFAVYNGWNSVVDGNDSKSVSGQVTFKGDHNLTASVLYFGGAERPRGAPEGQPWRHTFDAWVTWDVTSAFSFGAYGNGGGESNSFGTSKWIAGALYGRVQMASWLYLALRADSFWETVPEGASSIFWPANRVTSGTATLDMRGGDNFSFRLELRRDWAADDMFFRDEVAGDGSADSPYVPNATAQTTVTLGATAWF